jgi:lipoprotein-releasing system ATP-binding protein
MSEPLLVARDLEREYRVGPETVRVLRGVSMSVNPAESVALIGASGVGKSTLLHLLGGLDRPTSGQVVFAGEDLYGDPRTPSPSSGERRSRSSFSSTTSWAR